MRQRTLARLRAAFGPVLVVVLVGSATVAGLAARPGTGGTTPAADQVIVAGAVGLRWDDVDPQLTPHLWALAEEGAVGSLAARSARTPTCAADGWLTLGAGNRAAERRPGGPCPPLEVTLDTDNGLGAELPEQEQQALVRYNQWELPWQAVPGALAGAVECAAAYGPGAAVAAARSFGRVDRYRPGLPADPEAAAGALAGGCELAIVDLGVVAGDGARRAATVAQVDAALGRVLDARPAGALVLVAGVAEPSGEPRLLVAVAAGPDRAAGWLTSATTGRTGYLQLVDLAPTVLAALGRPAPDVPLAGRPATVRPGRPAELADAVAELVAADRESVSTGPVGTWFLAGLTAALLGLLVAVVLVPALHSSRPPLRRAPPPGLEPGQGRPAGSRVGPVLLVAAALALPAALVAGAVPWWRADWAGALFAAVWVGVLAAVVATVVRAPVFRRTLGLVGTVAGLGAVAVAADLLTGSRLQLGGVVGYAAPAGDRYLGLGPIGLGVLIAGTLLVAGCLAERVGRRRRPLVVATVGAVGVVLAGSPLLGADIGGALALLVGVLMAATLCTGGWMATHRWTWPVLAGLAVVAAVAVADLQAPPQLRTGLGSALTQFAEGTAGFGLQRVSLANAAAFTGTPLTVLAIGAGAFLWLALLRPWGGLRRLFGVHPALRAGVVGGAVASLLGGILVGAALTVVGAAAAVGVPLLTVAALRLRSSHPPIPHAAARPPAHLPGPPPASPARSWTRTQEERGAAGHGAASPHVRVESRGAEDQTQQG